MAENASPLFDLHLHSCWSYDAGADFTAYFQRAREIGVRCVAITDHHGIDGHPEAREIALGYPEIRLVPGAEFTVTTSFGSVDLVCYGFGKVHNSATERLRALYGAWQQNAGAAISRGLVAMGYGFDDAERLKLLRTYRPERAISAQGNTHLRNAVMRGWLLEHGCISTPEAFDDFMFRARDAGGFQTHPPASVTIPLLKEAGALIAIAHPFKNYFQGADGARMAKLREECALDGIECAHPSIPPEYTAVYRRYCVENGLFSTGGSDCHFEEDMPGHFGRYGTDPAWLDEFLARLPA